MIGIVLATILGTLIGIGRLSSNWLLARLTAFYVETLRDIPLLLQLLFWYALLQGLPAPRQALHIGSLVFLSNRGIRLRGAGTGSRPTPGRSLAFLAGRGRHLAVEPPRSPAPGGDRTAARGLAGGACCC